MGLEEFLNHVRTLIKIFRQFMIQKLVIDILSRTLLKSFVKMKLS